MYLFGWRRFLYFKKHLANPYFSINFALANEGLVAEWLGGGLQNLSQRFESARDLKPTVYWATMCDQGRPQGSPLHHPPLHYFKILYCFCANVIIFDR